MFTNEIEDGREALQKPSLNKYLNYFFQKVRFLNTVVFKTIVFTNDRFQKRSFLKTIVLRVKTIPFFFLSCESKVKNDKDVGEGPNYYQKKNWVFKLTGNA